MRPSGPGGTSRRLFRCALRLLPRDLRERFAADMEADLAERLEGASGRGGRLRVAAAALGDLTRTAADLRVRRLRGGVPRLEIAGTAVRHAARALLRRPAFAGGAVVTLSLALTLLLVAFSVLDGALLRSLPYDDGERLAIVNGGAADGREVSAWPGALPGVEAAAAFGLDRATATTTAGTVEAGILAIGPGFTELVGLPLEAGRPPTDDELRDGAPVVLVTRSFWRRIHGEAPLSGQTIALGDGVWNVVGIVPDAFVFYRYEQEVYRSLVFAPGRPRTSAVARLAPGAALDAVLASLSPAAEEAGARVSGALLGDILREDLRGPLWVLLLAASLVLLIASANVASLAVARNVERGPELAIRRALGAGRGRVAGQIVAEGLLLAAAGGAIALGLAGPLRQAVLAAAPGFVPAAFDLSLGRGSFGLAALAVLAITAAVGLAPALMAAGRNEGRLRSGMGRDRRRAARWMGAMIALETAFATTLVVGSVLLVRTFLTLVPTDPGFAVGDRLTVELRAGDRSGADDEALRRWSRDLLEAAGRLDARPRAALVSWLPLSGMSAYVPATLPDAPAEARPVMVHHRAVSASYADIMEIRPLRGRPFTDADDELAPAAILLNERAVRALFPDRIDALGRVVRVDAGRGPEDFTVVGVLPDARVLGGTTESRPEAWTPILQTPSPHLHVVLAPGAGPLPGADELRPAFAAVDPRAPILAVETLASVVGRSMVVPRFQLTVLGVLTGAGLLLAAVGCFAVQAFRVRGIRRELAIRQALGATAGRLGRSLVIRSLLPVAGGAAAGAWATWAAAGWIASRLFLYGVDPRAPGPYVAALSVMAGVAIAGAVWPTLHASRATALRSLRDVDA